MNRTIAKAGANLLALGCIGTIIGATVYGFALGYGRDPNTAYALVGAIAGLIIGTIAAALTFGPLAALYDMRASLEKLANAA